MKDSYDDIVVGAGIAGIVAGLVKAQHGRKVLLVDNATEAGGLMRSFQTPQGHTFDYGTHLLCELGDEALDDLLFAEVRDGAWIEFDGLQCGHFVHGQLGEISPVVDAAVLPEADYFRGLYELTEATASCKAHYASLAEQLHCQFGKTISEQLMIPAAEKLFFQCASHLTADSHLLFGLARVQGYSAQAVRMLKQLPLLDEVLAFRSFHEGKTGQARFYPESGGVGAWVDILLDKFVSMGGSLSLGTQISDIEYQEGKISALTIGDQRVATQLVTWTVPLFGLLKLLPVTLSKPAEPLLFLDSYLIHLIVDHPPSTAMHYYCNYDPQYSHFRTTLYSNMQGHGDANGFRATVELFRAAGSSQSAPDEQAILDELKACGVFPSDSKLRFATSDFIPNSFPVPTHAFRALQKEQLETVKATVSNIQLFGKARGDIFFMNDVILDVYKHTQR